MPSIDQNISTTSANFHYSADNNSNPVINISLRTLSSPPNLPTTQIASTSSQYIPEEFILENRLYFAPLIASTLLIGIIANVLAIISTRHAIKIFRTHRSRKIAIASFLIQCLMVVDLSAVVFFFIRGMLYSLYSKSFFKCDFDSVTNYFFSWSAGFINALMCCERCIALTAPFYYHSNATVGKAKVAVVIVLFISFVIAMLPIFGFSSYKTLINGRYYCIGPGDFRVKETDFDFAFGILFLVIGLGIIIFIHICNVIVIGKIIQLRQRSQPMRRNVSKEINNASKTTTISKNGGKEESSSFIQGAYETSSSHSSSDARPNGDSNHRLRGRQSRIKKPGRTEINVAKQIVVISIVFTLSWMPFYIQRLLKVFEVSQPDWYLLLVIFLLVSNHVIDPFVFVFMKQQSRDALKDLCMKCACCRRFCPSQPSAEPSDGILNNGQAFSATRRENHNAPSSLQASSTS